MNYRNPCCLTRLAALASLGASRAASNCPKWLQSGSKMAPEMLPKMLRKSFQNHAEIASKIASKWFQNGSQNGFKMAPKMLPKWLPKWLQNGFKNGFPLESQKVHTSHAKCSLLGQSASLRPTRTGCPSLLRLLPLQIGFRTVPKRPSPGGRFPSSASLRPEGNMARFPPALPLIS